MANNSVLIKIDADDTDFRKKMDGLGNITKKSAGAIGVIAGAVGGVISSVVNQAIEGIKALAAETLTASDALTKFSGTMSFAGFGKNEINAAREEMKKYADETVFDLGDVMNTTAQLAANGITNYTDLTQAAGNLTAVAGGGADAFKAVAMMLTQTAGAGKLTTENWNQLTDAIPGASGKLQQAMLDNGAYTGNFRDAMAQGQITADEFNQAILNLGMSDVAKEAATSTETFEGAFGNLKANVVSGFNDIIDAIGKGNITGAISKISSAVLAVFGVIVNVIAWCSAHSGLLKSIAASIGIVVGALALLKTGLAISSIISGVSAAFAAATSVMGIYAAGTSVAAVMSADLSIAQRIMGTVIALATGKIKLAEVAQWAWNAAISANPIGLIILAVVAFIAIIVVLWKKCDWFREMVLGLWEKIKAVWDTIQPYLEAFWEKVKSIFSAALEVICGFISSAWAVIKTIWDAISPYLAAAWEVIKAIFSFALQLIFGYFQATWILIKAVWDFVQPYFEALWEAIKTVFSVVAEVLGAFFENAWKAIKFIWDLVQPYFSGIWNAIKMIFSVVAAVLSGDFSAAWEGIKAIWNAVVGWFQGIWDGIVAVFKDVVSFFRTKFSDAYETVKEKFTVANFKTIFKDSICGGLEDIIEDVKTAAGKVWTEIKKKFQEKIELFFNIGSGGVGGVDFTGFSSGGYSPFGYGITSGYGKRKAPKKGASTFHKGIDFGAPKGTPIQSPVFGTIISAGSAGGYGNCTRIRAADGTVHLFAHQSRFARTGGRVWPGAVIGYVGSTGVSTGPHLHYSVLVGGNYVNPMPWVSRWRGKGYATGGFPLQGEMFVANENGIEMMGKMGGKNVVANNMQIIEGIKAGIASGMISAARAKGSAASNNTNVTQNLHFYKENVSPSETKRAARRGVKTVLAGGV